MREVAKSWDRRRLDIDPTRSCRIDVQSASISWSLQSEMYLEAKWHRCQTEFDNVDEFRRVFLKSIMIELEENP